MILVVYQEQYSYYRGVISYENLKDFINSQLPTYLVTTVRHNLDNVEQLLLKWFFLFYFFFKLTLSVFGNEDFVLDSCLRFTQCAEVHRYLDLQELLSKTGVTKLRPAGQIRPAKPFHPARVDILPMRKNNITKENLLIWQKHFLKQSHFVRCPALGLLNNSICGPRTVE